MLKPCIILAFFACSLLLPWTYGQENYSRCGRFGCVTHRMLRQKLCPVLSLNPAPDYGNRGDITVSAEVLNGSEHNGYKAQTGKLRIFQDGQEINSAEQSLEAKTNYYRLTSADNHELAGKVIQVAVYADNPNDVVKCGIKVTGEEEPVHHVEASRR